MKTRKVGKKPINAPKLGKRPINSFRTMIPSPDSDAAEVVPFESSPRVAPFVPRVALSVPRISPETRTASPRKASPRKASPEAKKEVTREVIDLTLDSDED